MTVIAIANQKGGVGKTATAINLGSALALKGYRVLIIDLDPQANSTLSLGYSRSDILVSVYEVLLESVNPLSAVMSTVQENLFILPANDNLPGAEILLADHPNRTHILALALSVIRESFDFIFIDSPPSLGILTLNALVACDGVLITMQPEFLAMEGLSQLMRTIELVRSNLNPDLKIAGVLFTMHDMRTRLTREVEDEVRKYFESDSVVYKTFIPRNVRVAEAPSHGLPVTLYAKSSPASLAYKELAEEFIHVTQTRIGKGLESPDTSERTSRGTLGGPSAADRQKLGHGDTPEPDPPEPKSAPLQIQ
ncbi:MAG TPA: ParA family protein [Firmicutes bacterium]|nr:ParA family protein [Bacillota bacterium]